MEEIKYKDCYYCGEKILKVAKKCKHCGEMLIHDSKKTILEKEDERKYYPNFWHGLLSAVTIGYWLPFWAIFYYHRDKNKYR